MQSVQDRKGVFVMRDTTGGDFKVSRGPINTMAGQLIVEMLSVFTSFSVNPANKGVAHVSYSILDGPHRRRFVSFEHPTDDLDRVTSPVLKPRRFTIEPGIDSDGSPLNIIHDMEIDENLTVTLSS